MFALLLLPLLVVDSSSLPSSSAAGDSVKYIRAAFTLAAKLSPCVVFIDEVGGLLFLSGVPVHGFPFPHTSTCLLPA